MFVVALPRSRLLESGEIVFDGRLNERDQTAAVSFVLSFLRIDRTRALLCALRRDKGKSRIRRDFEKSLITSEKLRATSK